LVGDTSEMRQNPTKRCLQLRPALPSHKQADLLPTSSSD
jgi:hypothetical protein